ncbi:hypothetical protein NOVOSPHI9U_750002 [Novosphingobium sp. 9U]|nr:hypothetical protein NOVOSPHI9U_750002 [Novosphingobium sp. 9U]
MVAGRFDWLDRSGRSPGGGVSGWGDQLRRRGISGQQLSVSGAGTLPDPSAQPISTGLFITDWTLVDLGTPVP